MKFRIPKDDPSFYQEFVECSSKYELPLKEDSEEISDGQEFDDAKNLKSYEQDASEVFMIEQENEWKSKSGWQGASVPNDVKYQASALREQGYKSKRDKGYKHFTQVAFQGSDNKEVPRWAINDELLKKIKNHQSQKINPLEVFGKWGPKVVKEHFNEALIFKKGINPDMYTDEKDDKNLFRSRVIDRRGSSENWDD